MSTQEFETKMKALALKCIEDAIRARRDFRRLAIFGVVLALVMGGVTAWNGAYVITAVVAALGAYWFHSTWKHGERFYRGFMKLREDILRDVTLFRSIHGLN